jgi:hypothetical protein
VLTHKEHLPQRGESAEQELLYDAQTRLLSPSCVRRRLGVENQSLPGVAPQGESQPSRPMDSLCVRGSTSRPTVHIMYDFMHKVQPAQPRWAPRRTEWTP